MSARSDGVVWGASDARRAEAVEQDIRAELEAHLALRAEDEVGQGRAPEEARARAAEAFGDFERVVEECRRVRLREVYLMQSATMALMAATVAAVLLLAGATFAWRQDTHATLEELRTELSSLNAAVHGPASGASGVERATEPAEPREIVLRVGDTVSYCDSLSGVSGTGKIARDGELLLPDVGWFHLEGLSRPAAERALTEAFLAYYEDVDIKLELVE